MRSPRPKPFEDSPFASEWRNALRSSKTPGAHSTGGVPAFRTSSTAILPCPEVSSLRSDMRTRPSDVCSAALRSRLSVSTERASLSPRITVFPSRFASNATGDVLRMLLTTPDTREVKSTASSRRSGALAYLRTRERIACAVPRSTLIFSAHFSMRGLASLSGGSRFRALRRVRTRYPMLVSGCASSCA